MLDDEVVGVSYGKICTIMGFVSHFKTSLARSIMYHNAKDLGYNFAVVSLEGQKEELYIDLLSMHSSFLRPQNPIAAKSIKKGLLSKEDEQFLYEVEESFKSLKGKIHLLDAYDIMDGSRITISSFLAAIDKVNVDSRLDGIIVDYIQLFGNYNVEGARTIDERRNAIVEMLTQLAIHYNSPQGLIIFLLSQTNRDGWRAASRNNGKYTLKALSSMLISERASYYVVALYTNSVLEASNELSIQLLKHRGGAKIEDPFTTFVDPRLGLIGDIEGYGQIFSEELLEDEDIFKDIEI